MQNYNGLRVFLVLGLSFGNVFAEVHKPQMAQENVRRSRSAANGGLVEQQRAPNLQRRIANFNPPTRRLCRDIKLRLNSNQKR